MPTRTRAVIILSFLALAFAVVLVSSSSRVEASVSIISIDPDMGIVGSNVTLVGKISTLNGAFNVTWNNGTLMLAQGNAIGYVLNVTFAVPGATGGLHNVSLYDLMTGENSIGTFEVETGLFEYLFWWWAITISAGSIFLALVGVYLYLTSRKGRREITLRLPKRLVRSTRHFIFVWVLLGLLVFYIISIDIGSDWIFAAGNIFVEAMLLIYLFRNRTKE